MRTGKKSTQKWVLQKKSTEKNSTEIKEKSLIKED